MGCEDFGDDGSHSRRLLRQAGILYIGACRGIVAFAGVARWNPGFI
jgi:hypothetical protein